MNEQKLFPLLYGPRELVGPRSVPWSFVEPAREQAMDNHSQTLERLAERGGLSPIELYGALHRMRWGDLGALDHQFCVEWIQKALAPNPEP